MGVDPVMSDADRKIVFFDGTTIKNDADDNDFFRSPEISFDVSHIIAVGIQP